MKLCKGRAKLATKWASGDTRYPLLPDHCIARSLANAWPMARHQLMVNLSSLNLPFA